MDLKEKMESWGPYGKSENKVLIFSIGNEYEGHGPALPKDTDSRIAKYIAQRLAHESGQRYCAHIPFQTDRVGKCAQAWMPLYIPMEEFAQKVTKFINNYCEIIKDSVPNFKNIVIINGHGGNKGLEAYLKAENFPVPVQIKFAVSLELDKIVKFMETKLKMNIFSKRKREMLALSIGHADDFEHSVAHAVGIVDEVKLKELNEQLKKDFENTLKKYPVLGGLGGYIEFGDENFDVLRLEKLNLVECYQKFKNKGKIELFPELGQATIQYSIEELKSWLQQQTI